MVQCCLEQASCWLVDACWRPHHTSGRLDRSHHSKHLKTYQAETPGVLQGVAGRRCWQCQLFLACVLPLCAPWLGIC